MKNKIWNKAFLIGRIATKFLDYLAEAIEGGYILSREFSDIRGNFTPFWDELEEERDWFRKKAERRRIIYELKRRRLIEEKKTGDKVFYFLTDKGAAEITRRQILNCDKSLNDKLCLVIFDIPESQRHVRALLRKFLKEAGFKYLQQSAWVTNKDIAGKFRDFVKVIQADHWINIFIVESVVFMPSKSRARQITKYVLKA